MTKLIPTIEQSTERIKSEILQDVKSGLVPDNCLSFSKLHDYVDANCYGGFCEEILANEIIEHFGGRDENEGMPDDMMEYLNEAQNSVDQWLREGGIRIALDADRVVGWAEASNASMV